MVREELESRSVTQSIAGCLWYALSPILVFYFCTYFSPLLLAAIVLLDKRFFKMRRAFVIKVQMAGSWLWFSSTWPSYRIENHASDSPSTFDMSATWHQSIQHSGQNFALKAVLLYGKISYFKYVRLNRSSSGFETLRLFRSTANRNDASTEASRYSVPRGPSKNF